MFERLKSLLYNPQRLLILLEFLKGIFLADLESVKNSALILAKMAKVASTKSASEGGIDLISYSDEFV